MMSRTKIKDVKVAILATNGFEELELLEPKRILEEEGATTHVVSNEDNIISWHNRNWNKTIKVNK